jgi:hypothetical protein
VLESDEGCAVIAGQCSYCCAEYERNEAPIGDMHDAGWHEAGLDSLARVRALEPVSVYFSHDDVVFRRAH